MRSTRNGRARKPRSDTWRLVGSREPIVRVRVGFDEKALGIQVAAAHYNDMQLLLLARPIERLTEWRRAK